MHLILLPGLDGTGRLFAPLLAALAPGDTATVVVYSPTERQSYDDLQKHVAHLLPRDQPFVIVAESFSGPIAVRLAAHAPANLQAVVLCASFVHAPRGRLVHALLRWAGPWLCAIRPPRWSVRFLLTGAGASDALVSSCLDAIGGVAPSVLSHRLGLALAVDARETLRATSVPLLYLQATRDRVIHPASAAIVRQIRPDVTIVPIDAPHLLLQQQPGEALREISAWLRSGKLFAP